jgi:hypothetical protein
VGRGGRGRCQQGRGPAGRSGGRPAWARSSRAAAGGLRKGTACSGRGGRGSGVLDDDRGYELAARDDKGLDKLCSAARTAALLWRLPFSLHLRHGVWTQGVLKTPVVSSTAILLGWELEYRIVQEGEKTRNLQTTFVQWEKTIGSGRNFRAIDRLLSYGRTASLPLFSYLHII